MGLEEISRGRVAAILMAGGQGTRLGSKDPKGMFNVGLPSGKSLFQLQAERLLRLQQLAGASSGTPVPAIPWYVMTSEATDARTEQFFEEHNFFGLARDSVRFFEQGMYPALLEENGQIAMQSKGRIFLAPNGNGGIYEATQRTGIVDEMKRRGIKYIFVYGVDNIATRICDPAFVGLLKEEGGDCGVKVVPKDYPAERVGVVALRNGKPSVVEYSELDPGTAQKVGPHGQLYFNAGNICTHLYSIEFLERACQKYQGLAKHVAYKKIPQFDPQTGALTEPPKENGFKFEMFVFDVFELATKFVAMEVVRDEEFLPLKNQDGTPDSNPTSCRLGMTALNRKYLRQAGAVLDGDGLCEISPLVTFCGEGLEKVKGKTLKLPILLNRDMYSNL